MDNNQFTTTFIPKKPVVADVSETSQSISRPVGLFSSIATIIFFISLAVAGVVYFWKQYETRQVVVLSESVKKIEQGFEPQFIAQLQTIDKQLRNANILLKNHTVISPIFDMLQSSTLKQVRFTKFDLVFDDLKGVLVKMSGESDGYPSIASQADVLSKNSAMKDSIFSNFFLTQKGRISFDLSFGLMPDFVDFEKAPLTQVSLVETSSTIPAEPSNPITNPVQ